MKRLEYFWPAAACIPLLVGLLLAVWIQAGVGPDRILHFETRIDLGTLALLCGTSLTIVSFLIFVLRRTHRQALTRLRVEAAEAHRRFLGRLDHEMKNPLAALQTEIAYLSNDPEDHHVADALSDMSVQVNRLGLMVTDLRKLAELERRTMEFQPVDVAELLNEAIDVIQSHPLISDRQVNLTLLDTPWNLPHLPGDKALLSLALYNLLDNALKFTHSGDAIELRAFEIRPWIVIEIADSGSGIADEDLSHIFEELYRGSNARGCPGSGLGLAMVRAIIEHHHGSIYVQSRFNQGTVFTIRLPLKSREPD